VKLWDVDSGRNISTFDLFKVPVFSVAFAPDGRTLAIGGGNAYSKTSELKLVDPVSGREKLAIKSLGGTVFSVTFAPDGKTLATAGVDQIVRLWDVETGTEQRAIRGHRAAIWSVAFDPTGKRLASASWDTNVKVWDATAPDDLELFSREVTYGIAFSPNGKYVAAGKSGVTVHEVADSSKRHALPYSARDVSLAFTPDGSQLVTTGDDEHVTFWEVGSWRRLASLSGHNAKIWCLAISPDGRTVATGGEDRAVRLWDVKEKHEHAVIQPEIGTISALAYTPDGRTLIIGSWSHLLFVDPANGKVQTRINGPAPRVAVSPDGRLLAVVRSHFFGMRLMDLATHEAKWEIKPHHDVIWSVRFSSDGKTLATASWDGTAKLWNVASGQEMFTYNALSVGWGQAFSRDGAIWAVGSSRGLTLFRRATEREVEAQQ
jgi:WD40 repeat protein